MTDTAILCFSFIIGTIIGSFCNVVSIRTISGEKFYTGFSSCPKCKSQIKWFDNIPLVSFVLLKRICRACNQTISNQYPFVEMITGIIFVLVISLKYAFITKILLLFISTILIIISIIDWYKKFIYFYHLLILGFSIACFRISIGLYEKTEIFSGSLLIGTFLLIVKVLGSKYYKRNAMGIGDIKLGFLLGLMLDFQGAIVALYITFISASLAGLNVLIRQDNDEKVIAFAPFLSFGAIISLFYNKIIIQFLF